ncbi:MAG: pentapeptide repeat-containing protein, partial [Oligoflexia bacterium]|nr:pentapeptide repeat-containing protein [Oligoflexia bacterium]
MKSGESGTHLQLHVVRTVVTDGGMQVVCGAAERDVVSGALTSQAKGPDVVKLEETCLCTPSSLGVNEGATLAITGMHLPPHRVGDVPASFLCGRILRGSVLRGSVLRGSVLRGSVLRGSVLRGS